jgi:hypothetical protein
VANTTSSQLTGKGEKGATSLASRVAQLTRERDEALAAQLAERERNAALLRQCDRLAAEIAALRQGTAPPWKPALVSEESRQLAHALQTIRNMERSWFWRLRLLSVRLRTLGGSRRC